MTQPEHVQTLEQGISSNDSEGLCTLVETLPAGEMARAVSMLSGDEQTQLLSTLPPVSAAELVNELPEAQALPIVEQLPTDVAAAIVHELPSNEQSHLVHDLPDQQAEAILAELEPEEADQLRSLSQYSRDLAGGLVITEFLSYSEEVTVDQVIDDMRANVDRYANYPVQYAYVTSDGGLLTGVLRLRDLLLARRHQPIRELMIRKPISLRDTDELDTLREFFDSHAYFAAPVLGARGQLLGVLRRADVEAALGKRSESDFRRSQGLVREELRTMPVLTRSVRRLAWLSVNILLNVAAASVIAFYQDTLAQVIALAVFLPIISDMSGCSGNQAVAVSMRELALGLATPRDTLRVWIKEILVGCINGAVLGALIASVAILWKGNAFLGLVVGSALALNTLVAVSIGGTLPLVLKRIKVDPALASGPILTTVTDMCGFFFILSLASLLLPRLLG
jgi:magnesium transporter